MQRIKKILIWEVLPAIALNSACWEIFDALLSPTNFFTKLTFSKNLFRNTSSVSNSLDPDLAQSTVGP